MQTPYQNGLKRAYGLLHWRGVHKVKFSEFAQMLYPFLGSEKYQPDFVVALVYNTIEEADDGSCPLLDKQSDYLTRMFNGSKPLPKKDAAFILKHLDKGRFESYISELTDDGVEGLRTVLAKKGIVVASKYEVASQCADLFTVILTECASSTRTARSQAASQIKAFDPFEALKNADALLATIPAPPQLLPPAQPLTEEQPYIRALYAAYGDKEKITGFGEEHLVSCGNSEYGNDIKDRRIDYFAAESIRRGVSELYAGEYTNQFDVLKEETFQGVKNTALKTYPNGYERLLGVMEQAAIIEVRQYILSQSPNWISNRIKCGVCHFLVNENKLKWVKQCTPY